MKLASKLITLTSIVLVSTACSSGGSAYSAKPSSPAWKTAQSIKGQIFTDESGKSLYTFDKDSSGVSNCYGACAAAWPPFAASQSDSNKGAWTIISRKDGSKQWALNGQPLYTFAADKAAGDVRGDGVNNVWHLAKANKSRKTVSRTAEYSGTGSY